MANELRLNRNQLAAICGNDHRAIATLEKVLSRVDTTPTTIEEAVAQANQAAAMAAQALAVAADIMASLEALMAASAPIPAPATDDTAPAVQLGSMSGQNDDDIAVTGGTLAGVKISTPAQITSTLATGSAPLVIASTTRVMNLNAEYAGTADGLSSPSTYPADATDLPTVIALANALKSAAILKGL